MKILMPPSISQGLDWLKAVLKPDTTFILAITALAALVAIMGFIIEHLYHPIGWAISLLRNLWRILNRHPTIPRNTMLITPQDHNLWLSQVVRNEEPATQLIGDWHVTNITDRPIFLLKAEITSPRKARTIGFLPRGNPPALQPDQLPVSIHITFVIQPSVH